MSNLEFSITDNTDEVLKMKRAAVEAALEAVGMQVESFAKLELETKPRRIDTGLLRNSITHAVSGKPAAISSYHSDATHAVTEATKKAGTAGKPVDPPKEGHYFGNAPNDPPTKKAVYIGTNVNYAVYVHNGARKMRANRFLKNAITKNKDTLKAIFETYLKQAP